MNELLTTQQKYEADRLTIEAGISGIELMRSAGETIADFICQQYLPRKVSIICGPGNNGGDGFVIGKLLAERDWKVEVIIVPPAYKYRGDALMALDEVPGEFLKNDDHISHNTELIIDALFGAGLTRAPEGVFLAAITQMNDHAAPVLSVDIPSGIEGSSGAVLGVAVRAEHTVTFFRKKHGHLLMPAKVNCGAVTVTQIGVEKEILPSLGALVLENGPEIWAKDIPVLQKEAHKYTRGSVLVFSGGAYTSGAARLAAMASFRSGAGVVTMVSPSEAMDINAAHLTEIMLRKADTVLEIENIKQDERHGAFIIGPGAGVGSETKEKVLTLLDDTRPLVLDADGLTSFKENPHELFQRLKPADVLTPHEGEFRALFSQEAEMKGSKVEKARSAAKCAGAVLIYKGNDTVIAAPDGRAVINSNGTSVLATAGSGDVLAGITVGLIAQGMDSFEAACAAVWIHAEAGNLTGVGAIASDFISKIPNVLRQLAA